MSDFHQIFARVTRAHGSVLLWRRYTLYTSGFTELIPRQSIRELTQHGAAPNRGGVRILENWGGLYDEILGAPLFKRNV